MFSQTSFAALSKAGEQRKRTGREGKERKGKEREGKGREGKEKEAEGHGTTERRGNQTNVWAGNGGTGMSSTRRSPSQSEFKWMLAAQEAAERFDRASQAWLRRKAKAPAVPLPPLPDEVVMPSDLPAPPGIFEARRW